VRVDVASVSQFFELVRPAYLALLQTPPGEPAELEVVLAPGDYRRASLSVGDRLSQRTVDVVIRGSDADRPPLLTDVTLSVAGDDVRLEHLVLRQRLDHLPVVSVAAGRTLTIDRCAFVGNQVRMPPEGRLIELVAANPSGGTEVAIRQTWFIRNWASSGQALIACDTQPPGYFERVAFDRVAFLDNHVAIGIVPHATAAVQLSDCVVVPNSADADTPTLLAAFTSPGSQLTLERSLIVADTLEGLVSRWSARHPSASDYQPVLVNDSVLALHRPPPAEFTPPGYLLSATRVGSASSIEVPSTLVDRWVKDAERGVAPDIATLRSVVQPDR
jgi:hypothetical protein